MSELLNDYREMRKEAEAQEIVDQQVEFLAKYASAAEELLAEEYGNDYNEQDVVDLAEALIASEGQEEHEKVAEADAISEELIGAFVENELEKMAAFGFGKKRASLSMKQKASALIDAFTEALKGAKGVSATKKWGTRAGAAAGATALLGGLGLGGYKLMKKED